MEFNKQNAPKFALYAASLGGLFATFGTLEILNGLGWLEVSWVPGDIFGGMALLVIAAVFFRGVNSIKEGQPEGLSFLFVGAMLAVIFGALYGLVLGASGLNNFLFEEEGWSITEELRIEIALGLLALPAISLMNKFKNRLTVASQQ
ncbi:hypothetical protein [Candidatus Pyrohabitans sp.]